MSCAFAGLLGGFYAHYYGSLTPQTLMHTSKTVEVLAIAYIGGRGTLWGGIAFAFPSVILMEYLRSGLSSLPGLHLVIYGILMILVMIYYPSGLAGMYYWLVDKLRRGSNNTHADRGRAGCRLETCGSILPAELARTDSPDQHAVPGERGASISLSPTAVAVFRRHGVKTDGSRVFLSEAQLLNALESVPRQFTVQARNPAHNVTVGGGRTVFAPGYGAPFLVDAVDGVRAPTMADYHHSSSWHTRCQTRT